MVSSLPRWTWADGRSSIALFLGVLVGYVAGARLAFVLTDASGLQAVFFSPAGLTVGLLLLLPVRRWPVVLAAACAAELMLDLHAGLGVGASVGFAVANLVEPALGALVTRRWARPINLARLGHVIAFVVGAVLVGPLVGATIGASVDAVVLSDEFFTTWAQWWVGDALGVMIVGGCVLAFVSSVDRRSSSSRPAFVLVVGSVVFAVVLLTVSDLPLLFLVLIGIVAAGAQFGTRMVAVTAAAIALTIAIDVAFDDSSLIVGVSPSTALVLTQLQLGLFTAAGLIVAAEAYERERAIRSAAARQQIVASRRQLRTVIDSLFINVAITTADGVLVDANERGYQVSGQTPETALGRPFWELPIWSYDVPVAALLRGEIEQASATKQTRRFDIRAMFPTGLIPLDFQIVPVLDANEEVERLILSSIDITERLRYESEVAESLARQRTINRRLQRSLLPDSLPEIDGMLIEAVYQSAGDLEVGGDWYDAFYLDDGRLALVIGDVVGRGIDAAGATGQLRSATRAIADISSGPADVIRRLDRFVAAIPAAIGATMIYLECDLASGEVRFCRAGAHPAVAVHGRCHAPLPRGARLGAVVHRAGDDPAGEPAGARTGFLPRAVHGRVDRAARRIARRRARPAGRGRGPPPRRGRAQRGGADGRAAGDRRRADRGARQHRRSLRAGGPPPPSSADRRPLTIRSGS